MTPVIPCSISDISSIPVNAFITKKNNCLTRCSSTRKSTKHTLSLPRYVLPFSSSVRLFSQCQRGCALYHKSVLHILSATGIDVAVEESDSPAADEDSARGSDIPSDVVETGESSATNSDASSTPPQSKRSRPVRKSEMPLVKNEELIPGSTFTGKVRSIQPFGAFVDFGAFTDGLVHVSRLSDSFVQDVGSFVSVGQEVKVRLIEANTETGRISLTMRESDDISNLQQQKDAPSSNEKVRPARRNTSKSSQRRNEVKTTKFVKGQDLEGTVKNLTRAGAFISLPEGEEGFLPTSEESDDGFGNMMGGSSLQVDQDVSVRVLRITRGQITLTMKKEGAELDLQLTQGIVHEATNPFVLAFRKNKDIAAFLDERNKAEKASEQLKKPKEIEGKVDQSEIESSIEVQDQPEVSALSAVDKTLKNDEAMSQENVKAEIANIVEDPEIIEFGSSGSVDGAVQTIEKEETSDTPEASVSTKNQIIEEAPSTNISEEVAEQVLTSESPSTEEVIESQTDDTIAKDEGQIQTPTAKSEIPTAAPVEEVLEPNPDKTSPITSSGVEPDVSSPQKTTGSYKVDQSETESSIEVQDQPEIGAPSAVDKTLENDEALSKENVKTEIANTVEDPEIIESGSSRSMDGAVQTVEKEETSNTPEASVSTENQIIEEAPSTNISKEVAEKVLTSESPSTEVIESQPDDNIVKDELQIQTLTAESEIPTAAPVEEVLEPTPDKTGSITSSGVEPDVSSPQETTDGVKIDGTDPSGESVLSQTGSSESQVIEELVENQFDGIKDEVQIPTPAAERQVSAPSAVEDEMAGPALKENGNVGNPNVQTDSPSPQERVTKATISPALVKQLREETGAGMMDCKKALAETGGDIVKAQEFLRKKGLASAEKKASRATAEGRIGSYIHDSRIGVLVEVNCETDFVSRGDIFKELVDDLAMQVVACPQVQYLVTEDVPEEIVNKEKEIEMQKEDLLSKPEQIRSKIVEGRIRKRLDELALLEQPYIKNDKIVVQDWVKQTIATIGENIKVKRFVRYNLGEGLEKKSQDFAAEVAAQTAAKPAVKDHPEPTVVETKETVQKPPTAAISAALVKQLREETGAGMMDCKKALSETGGDLEKAQEYLRKKGLAAADKKSSRLAAEGRIGSYIHDTRIGVLIEVNCETDFVGRSEKFKELVDDLAMQVVACPLVQFVSIEDIPQDIITKEKELEMQREDLLSKPENIRERIVEGRVTKRLGELALLEQPYVKDDSLLVKDLVKQTVAALGENIKVRRFIRFTLGETTQDTKTETQA